jgi:PAS domain S-box-containing protein
MSERSGHSVLHRHVAVDGPLPLIDKGLARWAFALLAKCVLVACVYYVLVVISLKLRISTSTLALVWPSNALLVAVLALSPKRHWWAYLLSVVPAHISGVRPYHLELSWIGYQVGANSLLALACGAILQKFRPAVLHFGKLKETLVFLGVSIAVPGVTAFVIVYPMMKLLPSEYLAAHRWSGGLATIWAARWITSSASLMVFVPTILVCITRGREWLHGWPARRVWEGVLLTVLLTALTFQVYGHGYTLGYTHPAVYLIPLPLLLWAAVRFGPAGACLSITAFVCVSSWCAYLGEGPFLRSISVDRVTVLQVCWMMIAAPVLSLAAVTEERRQATLAFLESEGRFRQLFEQATVGVVVETLDGRICNVNPAFCRLLGYAEDELMKMPRNYFSGQGYSEIESGLLNELVGGQRASCQFEKKFLRKDGRELWGHVHVSLLKPRGDESPLVLRVLEDVTDQKMSESQLRQLAGRLIQAQEDERSRIARELHDDLAQRVSLLVFHLEQLRRGLLSEQSSLAGETAKLHDMASELASDIHHLSRQFHPAGLRYLGLGPALRELCERVSSQKPVGIEVRIDDLPKPIPEDISLCLFRVAQEALTNALKHSRARTIVVEGDQEDALVRLRISDDGVGFYPTSVPSGIGLTSMRERLRLVGGELYISSAPRSGTTITAQVRIP